MKITLVQIDEWISLTPALSIRFGPTPFWIQLYNLPKRHYQEETLQHFGGRIGEVITYEAKKQIREHGLYYCIRIKLDFTKPLKPFLLIGKKIHVKLRLISNMRDYQSIVFIVESLDTKTMNAR